MRFKLATRVLLFAGLCVCLRSVDMLLSEALAAQNSRIVYTAAVPDRHWVGVVQTEIYVMDSDGGNQERLTNNAERDSHPTWSPDRTKIAFISDRHGEIPQIYVMDNHGKNAIKLTDAPREKAYTDWSPDGRKIAFNSWDGFDRQNPRITVMDADGSNAFDLADGLHPSWSPDGQKIAFASGGDWKDQICVIGVDGNGFKRVTRDAAIKGTPEWSPDGKRIAYMALNHETYQIYVIRADGGNPVRLTHKPERHHMDPSWSPDGRLIAYMWSPLHLNPSPAKIHVMTADGESLEQLGGDHRGNEYYPDFGPVSLAVSPASNKITVWGRLKKLASNLRTR